jgi:hypothetical protein
MMLMMMIMLTMMMMLHEDVGKSFLTATGEGRDILGSPSVMVLAEILELTMM